MAALLRPATSALSGLLASGNFPRLYGADLFVWTLADNVTVYRWTNWVRDLPYSGDTYTSMNPWLTRSKWSITNKIAVPSLTVKLNSYNTGIGGTGTNLKTQIHNGLFDGASFELLRAIMLVPDDTTTFGATGLFGGMVSDITLDGVTAEFTIKGKTNQLDQQFPRNVYQAGCNHAFCDVGCTLNRATFTTTYTAGATPTSIFIPWNGAPPANFATYLFGSVTLLSGPGSGQKRTVAVADATGLTLAYPFYVTPNTGDSFSAFEGCTKAENDSSGQDCTARSNTQHYRGFEFIPPPNQAI